MVKTVDAPEGIEGQGFFATSLDKVIGIARSNSIWPLPFATSCCGIEFMATMGANYDLARFGSERLAFTPRQTDLLMVMGTISKKMALCLNKFTIKWLNPNGCCLWVLVLVPVGFSILTVFCKALIKSFQWMFMYPVVLRDPNKSSKD